MSKDKVDIDNKHITGGETDGGITSSYATDDGVQLKVPYSFMGSIYDEAEEGTSFEDLPDDWTCPLCGAGKEDFEEI